MGGTDDIVQRMPVQGWSGAWREDYVATFPSFVRKILEDGGYSYETAMRLWKEKNWLDTTGDRNRTKTVAFEGTRIRMVAIPTVVLQQRLGDEAIEPLLPQVEASLQGGLM